MKQLAQLAVFAGVWAALIVYAFWKDKKEH
jgi:cbb3-type cytochrome oxidase subunit 3